jgi:hypothetical protein
VLLSHRLSVALVVTSQTGEQMSVLAIRLCFCL